MPLKRQEAANGECRAKTKAGRQCAAPAVRGGVYCSFHNDPQFTMAMTIRTLVKAGFVVRKLRLAETVAVFWPRAAGNNASRKANTTPKQRRMA